MEKLNVLDVYANRPRKLIKNISITLVIVLIFLWSLINIKFDGINPDGTKVALNIWRALFNPRWEFLFRFDTTGVPYLMLETVIIAFLGTIIGMILSIPIAFISSKNITNKFLVFLGNTFIILIRTLPAFVIGIVYIRVVGPGAYAGVLTIAFTSIGMITKLYIETIEDMDNGIIEALNSSGANGFQKIRYGILPQLTPNFISHALYRFDINIRNAAILGLVGAGGIGFSLDQAIGNSRWRDAAACLWGIIIIVLTVEFLAASLRKKLIYGKK